MRGRLQINDFRCKKKGKSKSEIKRCLNQKKIEILCYAEK